jgi:hypothetical protein
LIDEQVRGHWDPFKAKQNNTTLPCHNQPFVKQQKAWLHPNCHAAPQAQWCGMKSAAGTCKNCTSAGRTSVVLAISHFIGNHVGCQVRMTVVRLLGQNQQQSLS